MRQLAFVLLLGVVGCSQRAGPEPVFLSMVQPLSGSQRAMGEQAKRAVGIAMEEFVNDKKQIGARDLIVQHIDSGATADSVRAETVRAISVNRTPVLLGTLSPNEGEILLREARLLAVPAVLAGEVPTPPSADGLLTLGVGPAVRGKALAVFVRENLKYKSVGLLIDDADALGSNLATAFARELRKGTQLHEGHFTSAEERAVALQTLTERKPDAVLLAGDVSKLRRALRDAGLSVPTLDGGSDLAPPPPGDDVPHYRVTVFAGTDLTAAGQAFAKKYRERYGEAPTVAAALSWEAVRFVSELMTNRAATTAATLKQALTTPETYEGSTGSVGFKGRQALRKLFAVRTQGTTSAVERVFAPGE